ncbi:MAG: hypothetical protein ACC608_06580 [Anaerofustis sp.]
MEQYRQTIKHRRTLLAAAAALIALILSARALGWMPIGKETFYDGFLTGFLEGSLTGIELIFVFLIARYTKALRNEETLKQMHINETDERKAYIRTKSGGWTMYITSVAVIIAGIVAGYYNMTVFFTMLAVGMFQLLVIATLKIYYSFRH